MNKVSITLSVYFADPFWIGIFECIDSQGLRACKVTFNKEPLDQEIYDLILQNYFKLNFSSAVTAKPEKLSGNPKRRQREASRQLKHPMPSTKAQLALKQQREEKQTERKAVNKQRKQLLKQERFELKRQKHKKKHSGR